MGTCPTNKGKYFFLVNYDSKEDIEEWCSEKKLGKDEKEKGMDKDGGETKTIDNSKKSTINNFTLISNSVKMELVEITKDMELKDEKVNIVWKWS